MQDEKPKQEAQKRELPRIAFSTGQFEANGKIYFIESLYSADRWIMKEEIEMEVAYGSSYAEMAKKWETNYLALNEGRMADASVIAYNAMKGIEETFKREPAVLKLIALCCNTADEDRTIITDDMITEKIIDFRKSGIPMNDFFHLAANIIPDFIENFKKATGQYSNSGSEQ